MTTFQIPMENMEELTKKINHIKNKGADIVFNVGKEVVLEYELPSGAKASVKCVEVEVEGKYQIEDWRFVGTIEHASSGNIIRSFDTSLEGKIPTKYRTVGQECEHCHQVRDRKDTYLVFNETNQEFKQVGKTCLRGYTGGLDAERCALFASMLSAIESLADEYQDFNFGGFSSGSYGLETESIKKKLFGYVKKNGYVPQETGKFLAKSLFGISNEPLPEATEEEVKEMDAWVKDVDTSKSDYMWNAKSAWTKEYAEYRDIALMSSFVSVYLKDKVQKVVRDKTANNAEYVGKVGDKVIITDIKSIRTLYVKDGGRYSYYASDTAVIEIIDAKGIVYVWSTTNGIFEEDIKKIDSIVATIKDHKEYKGVKQNIITRGKVTWKEDKNTNDSKTDKNADSLKDVFKMLDEITEE